MKPSTSSANCNLIAHYRSSSKPDSSEPLSEPLPLSLPLKFGYYIVSDPDAAQRSDVAAFRDWLLAESCRDPARGPKQA